MARFFQLEHATAASAAASCRTAVSCRAAGKPRRDRRLFGAHAERQSALRIDKVQFDEQFLVVHDARIVLCHAARELLQDPGDLRLLIHFELAQVVVQHDDRLRLDEQRLPACALVMDDARDLPLALRLDRHDISAVAHRDDGVLQICAGLLAVNEMVHADLDCFVLLSDLAADIAEFRARRIAHFILGQDAAVDLILKPAEHPDDLAHALDERDLRHVVLQKLRHIARRCEVVHDPEQLRHRERAALLRHVQRAGNIIEITDRQRSLHRDELHRFARLVQPVPNIVRVRHGREFGDARTRQLRPCLLLKHVDDLAVFKNLQCFLVHSLSSILSVPSRQSAVSLPRLPFSGISCPALHLLPVFWQKDALFSTLAPFPSCCSCCFCCHPLENVEFFTSFAHFFAKRR